MRYTCSGQINTFREVQPGEDSMVFYSGPVVCPSGVDFGIEVAEPDLFILAADFGTPFTHMLVKTYSYELRRHII